MSIKPVDFNTIIPKTLEVSNAKHVENLKNRNIVESGFINQEKALDRNKKRVLDVEKGINPKIRDDSNSKKHSGSQGKRKKQANKPSKKKELQKDSGNTIDIRI